MSVWGIQSESEKYQRRQIQDITDPTNLECQMLPLQSASGKILVIKEEPCCFVLDLVSFITFYLEKNKEYVDDSNT